jgi:hypothetical protein
MIRLELEPLTSLSKSFGTRLLIWTILGCLQIDKERYGFVTKRGGGAVG